MMNDFRYICAAVCLGALILSTGCSKDSLNTLASCGNGVLELGEVCDDGPLNADDQPYVCRTDCLAPVPSILVKGPTEMASNVGFTDTPQVPLQHVHHMILCGAQTHAITITNPGWEELIVSELSLTGPAQLIETLSFPLTIAPGEERVVPLSWEVGHTSMAVVSNAPGKERLRVYVEATSDGAPT